MYGLAALFWFPFALVIPAASCARILAPKALSGGSGMSWGQAFQCALLSGALLGAGIGTAAIMARRSFLPAVALLGKFGVS